MRELQATELVQAFESSFSDVFELNTLVTYTRTKMTNVTVYIRKIET